MFKNILLVYPSFERGGVKENFLSYIKIFSKKKYNLSIISDKNMTNYINFNIKSRIYILKNYKFNFFYKYFISLNSAYQIFKLRHLLKKKNLRVISFQSSFFSSIICKILNYKLIIRVSEDPLGATKFSDNFFLGLFVFLSKVLTYNLSYKILVNSKEMEKNLQKLVFSKSKIVLQYNMNLNKILKNQNKNKKNIFLNVGRLCKQKNQSILLKAFKIFIKENKNYELHLCGDGTDLKKLKLLSSRLNISKYVKFLGWNSEINKYLRKSKFFILPSLYEGLPNVLINALNYDLVCLASNVSGVKDICGKNFISINNKSPKEISKKMILAVEKYKFYLKQNFRNKKNLTRYLFKNLEKQLISNIR